MLVLRDEKEVLEVRLCVRANGHVHPGRPYIRVPRILLLGLNWLHRTLLPFYHRECHEAFCSLKRIASSLPCRWNEIARVRSFSLFANIFPKFLLWISFQWAFSWHQVDPFFYKDIQNHLEFLPFRDTQWTWIELLRQMPSILKIQMTHGWNSRA